MRHFGTRVVAGLLLAITLVACSGDDGDSSAESELGPRAKCVSADPEGELILLPGSVEAEQEPWDLTGVELRGEQNLEVVESSAVAFGGQPTAKGIILDYPPLKNAGVADSLADWDQRRQLPVSVTADEGLQAMLVAVRLVEPADTGRLTGVTLDYELAGEEHSVSWTQQVLVEPHDDVCTIDDVDATREWTG